MSWGGSEKNYFIEIFTMIILSLSVVFGLTCSLGLDTSTTEAGFSLTGTLGVEEASLAVLPLTVRHKIYLLLQIWRLPLAA